MSHGRGARRMSSEDGGCGWIASGNGASGRRSTPERPRSGQDAGNFKNQIRLHRSRARQGAVLAAVIRRFLMAITESTRAIGSNCAPCPFGSWTLCNTPMKRRNFGVFRRLRLFIWVESQGRVASQNFCARTPRGDARVGARRARAREAGTGGRCGLGSLRGTPPRSAGACPPLSRRRARARPRKQRPPSCRKRGIASWRRRSS